MKSLHLLLALALLSACEPSYAGGKRRAPTPEVSPSPSQSSSPLPTPQPSLVPSPLPSPLPTSSGVPSGSAFVTLGNDVGPSVDRAKVIVALDFMNQAVASGCLRAAIEGHHFLSLNSIFTPGVNTAKAAADEYLGGAPYSLNPRWYYSRFSKVIGYTYNYRDNVWGGESESRIWSNTKFISTPQFLAAHYAHELSHQARAGGFVHYTIFGGSFPYDVGDLMGNCVVALSAQMQSFGGALKRNVLLNAQGELRYE